MTVYAVLGAALVKPRWFRPSRLFLAASALTVAAGSAVSLRHAFDLLGLERDLFTLLPLAGITLSLIMLVYLLTMGMMRAANESAG
jgi:hypothetical protein